VEASEVGKRSARIVADVVACLLLVGLVQELLFHVFRRSDSRVEIALLAAATFLAPAAYLWVRHSSYRSSKTPRPFWPCFGIGFLVAVLVVFVSVELRPSLNEAPQSRPEPNKSLHPTPDPPGS
jgi:hypothetical protein